MANSNNETVLQLDLPGVKKLKSGKVREVFDLGDRLLFVASDRLSAFDVIMPNGIPRKGEVLTQISYFWFAQTESFQPNHLLSRAGEAFGVPALAGLPDDLKIKLARRSMIVKKAKPLAIECVVRGYLAGSGWKEYQKSHHPNCRSRFSRRPQRPRPATTKIFPSRRRRKLWVQISRKKPGRRA
jgi:phosphoribosylaminoimidazole-succinocarboxamide synthase